MAESRSTKIISTMKWIRTSKLSMKNSLSRGRVGCKRVLLQTINEVHLGGGGYPLSGATAKAVPPSIAPKMIACSQVLEFMGCVLKNTTVRGRVWCKLLDAPILTLDVTVRDARSNEHELLKPFLRDPVVRAHDLSPRPFPPASPQR